MGWVFARSLLGLLTHGVLGPVVWSCYLQVRHWTRHGGSMCRVAYLVREGHTGGLRSPSD